MVILLNRKRVLEILRQEPMFRESMEVGGLKPSIEQRTKEAMNYIELSTKPERNIPPLDDELEGLYESIRNANVISAGGDEKNCAVRMARWDARWPIMKRAMRENRGFYQFVEENGKDSTFMPEFYFDLPGRMKPNEIIVPEFAPNSAYVFDTPFGYYTDGDGIYKKIPKTDSGYNQARDEPFWYLVRYRDGLASYMREEMGDKAKVLSLGGGAAPEDRFFGWRRRGIKQTYTLYDVNKNLWTAFGVLYEKPLCDYGFTFYCEDSSNAANNPDLQSNQDLTLSLGVLSYYMKDLDRKFAEARCTLRTGGHFCGEYERMMADLGKSRYTLGWNLPGLNMDPYTDTNEMMDLVTEVAERNKFKVADLSTDEWVNGVETMLWMDLVAV